MVATLLRKCLKLFYRVEVKGLEHFNQSSQRTMIVANHTSFLDAALLYCFLPDDISFAIHTRIMNRWFMVPFRHLLKLFVMDPTNPFSLKSLIKYLKDDNRVVIFPEGRITTTGALMKIYNGPGLVADKANADVLPIRIDGAQYTPFSRLRGVVRLRWFPKITITLLPPRKLSAPKEVRGRERRIYAGKLLTDIMNEVIFSTSNYKRTLFKALIDAKNIHGRKHIIAEDIERKPISYHSLIHRSILLGDMLESQTSQADYVGILLPNMVSTLITFFALHVHGRVPAMLNFSTGAKSILDACTTANIKVIYTSKRFVHFAKLEAVMEQLNRQVQVYFLEDIVATISPFKKILSAIIGRFPTAAYAKRLSNRNPDSPAVVLFTSGSEGHPKGVVLSHSNLLANGIQMSTRVDFNAQDKILNSLPLFHSFGLTAGTLIPLIAGMKVFLYPSPLHYRIIPEIAYDIGATIMFGTNTFLANYGRFAHPYDFYSIRYVFAGAEKLQETTRQLWNEKFGIRVFEGYGTTETSPALSTNTAMDNRKGTVGRLLPGIEYNLEKVAGIENGGILSVKGPNIMLGYLLNEDNIHKVITPRTVLGNGWYNTGDIVSIDTDGFITILGRVKRFAKIAGEMISLTAVDEFLQQSWPEKNHVVIALPDERKGEQLVLLTEQKELNRKMIVAKSRSLGLSELSVPHSIHFIKKMPLLGSGKPDYIAIKELAMSKA